jgi:antitoxin component YwqK of YwqJK toxin-antitoxin module
MLPNIVLIKIIEYFESIIDQKKIYYNLCLVNKSYLYVLKNLTVMEYFKNKWRQWYTNLNDYGGSNVFQGFRIDYLDGIYLSIRHPSVNSKKPKSEGLYKNNKKNGKWKYTESHNITSTLYDWDSVYDNGILIKERLCINGKIISDFNWNKNTLLHGNQYQLHDGKERFKQYQNGMKHGRFIKKEENANFLLKDCTYVNGKKDGPSIERWWNKKIKVKNNWANGMKHGYEVEFHENGKIFKRSMFKNGLPTGEHKLWWPNGLVSSIAVYDETGNVISNIEFDQKGQKINYVTWQQGTLR